MRYMIIVKANAASEAGEIPSNEIIEAMGRFNDELIGAGVLVAGEGLQSSAHGARVKFSGGGFTVTDGPFANPGSLVAGFWIIDVRDRDEALAWIRKIPFEEGEEVELRKVFEAADFAEGGVDPQLIENERLQRERLAGAAANNG